MFLFVFEQNVAWKIVLYASLVFFINHLLSHFLNRQEDCKKIKNIGAMMFFPYARIIPMHLIIATGLHAFGGPISLVVFMLLKTFADVVMHVIEHKQ